MNVNLKIISFREQAFWKLGLRFSVCCSVIFTLVYFIVMLWALLTQKTLCILNTVKEFFFPSTNKCISMLIPPVHSDFCSNVTLLEQPSVTNISVPTHHPLPAAAPAMTLDLYPILAFLSSHIMYHPLKCNYISDNCLSLTNKKQLDTEGTCFHPPPLYP